MVYHLKIVWILLSTHIKALATLPEKRKNPTFIFVSRVVKMKGVEQVIKAFASIQNNLPKAQLWIVGGGDQIIIDLLLKMVQDLGLTEPVKFKGRVSEGKK